MPGGPLVVGGDDTPTPLTPPPTLVTPGVPPQFANPQFPGAPPANVLPPPQPTPSAPPVSVRPPIPASNTPTAPPLSAVMSVQPAPAPQPVYAPPPQPVYAPAPPGPGTPLQAGVLTSQIQQPEVQPRPPRPTVLQQFRSAAPEVRQTVQSFIPQQQPQSPRGSGIRAGAIGFSIMAGLFPFPFNPLFIPIQMTIFIIMIIVLLFKGWDFWTAALLAWLIPGIIAAVIHYMFLSGVLSMMGMGEEVGQSSP